MLLDPDDEMFKNKLYIVHELLHVIGFYHMHQSPARKHYVRVRWQAIREDIG